MGAGYLSRYDFSGLIEDLNRAITLFTESITGASEPMQPAYLVDYAEALQKRFSKSGQIKDLHEGVDACERAIYSPLCKPLTRIMAAKISTDLLNTNETGRAMKILKLAEEALPLLVTRSLSREDQLYSLTVIHGLARTIAAVWLEAGESAYEALQRMDNSMGYSAGLLLETRTDLTKLKIAHPEIAKQFQERRDELASLLHKSPWEQKQSAEALATQDRRRKAVAQEFVKTVDCVRSLHGFDRFLLGPTQAEILELASDGPIVVLNVSEKRSDAFLLTKDAVRSITLPDLQYSVGYEKVKYFTRMLKQIRPKKHAEIQEVLTRLLEWLWDVAVGRILDELGFKEPPTGNAPWPHVWWITSGWLNSLPIHAAGYHSIGSSRNVIDRVVSSYVPTIKSLRISRERLEKVADNIPAILVVSMEETPNQTSLPFVVQEVRELYNIVPENIPKRILKNPTKDEVLSDLHSYQICHFACHGVSGSHNPSTSGLLLNDWESNILLLSRISRPQNSEMSD